MSEKPIMGSIVFPPQPSVVNPLAPVWTQWRPIETAPKDGTVILLRQADDSLCGYAAAIRELKRHAVGYYKDWWVIGVPGGRSEGGGDHQFTHWMPIPPLPSSAAEDER
jgi:hypothetical protein